MLGLTGEKRTDNNGSYRAFLCFACIYLCLMICLCVSCNSLCVLGCHHSGVLHDDLACLLINIIVKKETSCETLSKINDLTVAVEDVVNLNALCAVAVLLTDDALLRNVNKTTGKIT